MVNGSVVHDDNRASFSEAIASTQRYHLCSHELVEYIPADRSLDYLPCDVASSSKAGSMDHLSERLMLRSCTAGSPMGDHPLFLSAVFSFAVDSSKKTSISKLQSESLVRYSLRSIWFRSKA